MNSSGKAWAAFRPRPRAAGPGMTGPAGAYSKEALCLYPPLPPRPLGMGDLIHFGMRQLVAGDYLILALTALVVALLGLILPYANQVIFKYLLPAKEVQLIWGFGGVLFAFAIASVVASACKQLVLARMERKLSLFMEAGVMSRCLNLPAGFFKGYASGDLSQRVQAAGQVAVILVDTIVLNILTAIFSLLYLAQIAAMTPTLVWPAVSVIAATALLSLAVTVQSIRVDTKQVKAQTRLSGMVYMLYTGIQKIKVTGSERRAFGRWAQRYDEALHYRVILPGLMKYQQALGMVISTLGIAAIYWICISTNVAVADYIAFMAAYGVVLKGILSLLQVGTALGQVKPLFGIMEPILKTVPETSGTGARRVTLDGPIVFDQVNFRYSANGPDVLNQLSFKIEPGEYIALTGESGSGKSTIFRLLLGFEQVRTGAITFSGADSAALDWKHLRRQMGVVLQDGALFSGSILDNILMNAPELSEDEAWQAARTAGIAEDIEAMPMGMHTHISEGDGGISGGQKQRILIARAIVHRPAILLMDEATSALDNATQKRVAAALDALNCTRIVIAHRLSTIRHCERILVLDRGEIVESGTFDELAAAGGLFSALIEKQRYK